MPIPFPKASTFGASSSTTSSVASDDISYPPSESSSLDREEESALIQEEWEESLRQLEVVLSIVIMPFFGKWWGRRWAYFMYERYEQLGWGRALFGLT